MKKEERLLAQSYSCSRISLQTAVAETVPTRLCLAELEKARSAGRMPRRDCLLGFLEYSSLTTQGRADSTMRVYQSDRTYRRISL